MAGFDAGNERRQSLDKSINTAIGSAFNEGLDVARHNKSGVFSSKPYFEFIKEEICKSIPDKYDMPQHDITLHTVNKTIDDVHKMCGEHCTLRKGKK